MAIGARKLDPAGCKGNAAGAGPLAKPIGSNSAALRFSYAGGHS